MAVDPALGPRGLRELDHAFGDLRLLGVRRHQDGEYEYVTEAPADMDLHADDILVVHGRRRAVQRLIGEDSQSGE